MKKPNATQEKVIIRPRPPKDAAMTPDVSVPCEEQAEAPVEGPAGGPAGGPAAGPGPQPAPGTEVPAEEEE